MNRQRFEEESRARWAELEVLLEGLEKKKRDRLPSDEVSRLPRVFRQVCGDLALAEYRMYGMRLTDRLNALVIRGYKHLYRGAGNSWETFLKFIIYRFPQKFRSEWPLFAFCMLMFWFPFIILVTTVAHDARWVHSILGPASMADLDSMYGKGESTIEHLRSQHGSNFMMFAFYVYNNIGITFRMFAGGILAGIGTFFFLLFNGIYLGAAMAYVHDACDKENFYSFVSGHAAFELIGIIIAGMAGLKIGLAIVHPGRRTRRQALKEGTAEALVLLYGAAGLVFLAAIIEGFWSATVQPPMVKYSVGIVMAILTAAYLTLSGRTRDVS